MQDPFTGAPTVIRGGRPCSPAETAALQDDHQRRLEALARLGEAAARVGIGTDPDDDLVLFPEDELSLLEGADPLWGGLAGAVRRFRATLPLLPLEAFGFPVDTDDPLGDGSPRLRRIGSGVEASAFEAEDQSIYKFYLPREEGRIGGSFSFSKGEETALVADACLGSYRDLLEKLWLILLLDGMPTEVMGITPEGVLVAKQALGARLPEGTDVSHLIPRGLHAFPARFIRAHRDHPRLAFLGGSDWFIADTHARNLVWDSNNRARVIDLLAARLPAPLVSSEPLFEEWLVRARADPSAPLLREAPDDEL